MRTLSSNALIQANSLHANEAFLFLVTISHPTWSQPRRYVANTKEVNSQGYIFTPYAFEITLSMDDGQTIPVVEVVFDNVSRELIDMVRALPSSPTVDIEVVLSNAPNVVELSLRDMTMSNLSFGATSIAGQLMAGDLLNAPYPADAYEPSQYPAIFN